MRPAGRRGHAGRLPQPLRRQLPRGQGPARCGGDRARQQHPRRGLRPGRAPAQGRNLAQPQGRGRRQPLRLRRPPDQPAQLVPGRADRRRRHDPELDLLPRDRRRGPQHPVLRRRQLGQGRGQLVRRVVPEDDHEHHRLGYRRPDLRRPTGVPGLSAGNRADPGRATSRAGTSATRPSSPSRSASTCAARSTAPRSTTSSTGSVARGGRGPERVRERRGHRPGDRDDARRRRARGRRRSPGRRQRPRGASAPTAPATAVDQATSRRLRSAERDSQG